MARRTFHMLLAFIVSIVCSANGSITRPKCPQDWHAYDKGNRCIRVVKIQKTWQDARLYCQQEGGDLVIIPDQFRSVTPCNNLYCWIGLSDLDNENYFKWVDKTDLAKFDYWDQGQPDGKTDQNCCVVSYYNKYKWRDMACNQLRPFICEQPGIHLTTSTSAVKTTAPIKTTDSITTEVTPSSPSVVTPLVCPQGWHAYDKGNKCIRGVNVKKTWQDARSYCQQEGGDLVAIPDRSTNDFIRAVTPCNNLYCWIGLSDLDNENYFKWVDKTDLAKFDYWDQGQPDGKTDQNCCVVSYYNKYKWRDMACNQLRPFICEQPGIHLTTSTNAVKTTTPIKTTDIITTEVTPSSPSVVTPLVCPQGWHAYDKGNKCIRGVNVKKTWQDARSYCQQEGGDLVAIPDRSTNDFIKDLNSDCPGSYCWIGLTDLDRENEFRWVDQTTLNKFEYWSPGQPDGKSNQNCGGIVPHEGYHWRDVYCDDDYHFLCQRPGITLATSTSTVKTTTPIKTTDIKRSDAISSSPSVVTPLVCPQDWHAYHKGNKCIRVVKFPKSWQDARSYCQQKGGDLVAIPDRSTNDFIKDLNNDCPGSYCWIGLTDLDKENEFRWVDKTTLNKFEYWSPDQPDGKSNQNCGGIVPIEAYHWRDLNCDALYHFFCQRPGLFTEKSTSSTPTTSSALSTSPTTLSPTITITSAPTTTTSTKWTTISTLPPKWTRTPTFSSPITTTTSTKWKTTSTLPSKGTSTPTFSSHMTTENKSSAIPQYVPHGREQTGLSVGSKVGIGVGCFCIVVLGIVIVFAFIRRSHINRQSEQIQPLEFTNTMYDSGTLESDDTGGTTDV